MKKHERMVWIATVAVLFLFSFFMVFVNNVSAGGFTQPFPYMQKFVSVFNAIKSDYVDLDAVDDKKLINGAIKGMLDAIGDPYTQYLSEEEMSDMRATSTGAFGGVGMIISEKDGFIGVVSPIEDTPAYRKGMKAGDLLISVDGETLKGVTVNEAAKRLKGVPGTTVKVEFLRDEMKYDVEFIRALIDLPTVKYDVIDGKIGYLRITQFSGTTDTHVKDALIALKNKNITSLIVDLRMNPGGLLDAVINIVDYFQDDGIIVSTKGRRLNEESVNKATKFNTIVPADMNVVVLIDGGSASASEIFAGAMKDNKRGILIGEKSFGKGSVQSIQALGDGIDGFKITTAKYFTPSGVCIHGVGIMPDIEVKEPELTDDEKEGLRKIYKDKVIDEFVKNNPSPKEEAISKFVADLNAKGYKQSERNIRKLVRNSYEYGKSDIPIYDMDFDIQLKKAVEVLEAGKIVKNKDKFILKDDKK